MTKEKWEVIPLSISTAFMTRSIKNIVFDERRVKVIKGVRFFLTADGCDETKESAFVRLEIVDDEEVSTRFEFEACINLEEVASNIAFSAEDIIEAGGSMDLVATAIVNKLAEEAELEIILDDYDNPQEVTFTLSINNSYCSSVTIPFSNVMKHLSVRTRVIEEEGEE